MISRVDWRGSADRFADGRRMVDLDRIEVKVTGHPRPHGGWLAPGVFAQLRRVGFFCLKEQKGYAGGGNKHWVDVAAAALLTQVRPRMTRVEWVTVPDGRVRDPDAWRELWSFLALVDGGPIDLVSAARVLGVDVPWPVAVGSAPPGSPPDPAGAG